MYIDQTGDVTFGFNTSGSTNSTNLFNMSLGGTYHDTKGSYPKLSLWHDGTDHMGFGVSGNQLDYILTSASYDHVFYGGNAGTTELLRIKGGTGKVGIGTGIPQTELEVQGDSGGTIRLAKGGANRREVLSGDTLGKIEFRSYDSSLNHNSYSGTYAVSVAG